MGDEIDLAQAINEQFQENCLAAHRKHRPAGESNTRCEDCGEDIPEKRRHAMPGCKRCIACQTLHENWRAL